MITFAQAIDFVYTVWQPVDLDSNACDNDDVQIPKNELIK